MSTQDDRFFGRWRGDEVPPNYQDLVIMTKQET